MSDRPFEGSGRSGRLADGAADGQALYACLFRPPLPGRIVAPGEDGATDLQVGRPWDRRTSTTDDRRPTTNTLIAIAAEFSPRYEQHRSDLVSLDVRGLSRLFGTPRAIGEELRREAATRGVRVHVALARTRMAALVLAVARPGLTVVTVAEQAAALAPIPLGVLEQVHEDALPGAGNATQGRVRADEARAAIAALKRWGVRTLGDLAALPAADLSARLGRGGLAWQAIARGDEVRPLVPLVPEERFEGSTELEWPIEGHEPLSFVLTRLLEPLSTRLERRDRGAAVLHIALRLVTRDVHTCRLELPSPLRDVRALRTLALLDLEAHPPAAAIDMVTVTIEPTPGRIVQHALFARPHPTPEQLSTLLARLGALMGLDRVGTLTQVDSYRPGAFAMAPFSLDHADIGSPVRPSSPAPRAPTDSGSLSPDGLAGARPTAALRRCRQPVPARVVVDAHQRPRSVSTERRGFAGGAVLACAGPWRTSGAWWDEDGGGRVEAGSQGAVVAMCQEANFGRSTNEKGVCERFRRCDSGAWSRDEWDVSLDDGAIYRIFRDRTTDRWFIEAVVD